MAERVGFVKDWVELSNSPQLAAFHRHAVENGLPFNLIIGPRTKTISAPLLDNVRQTNGVVRLFDPVTGKFAVDVGKTGAWAR